MSLPWPILGDLAPSCFAPLVQSSPFVARSQKASGSLLAGRFGIPSAASSPIDRRLVIGAAIFGVGWGLGGFCPGPALANLGAFRPEALFFVPAMTIGMLLAQRLFGADR